jgi:hypothetical protein
MTVVYVPGLSASPSTLRRRAVALIAALLAAAGLIAAVLRVTPDRDFPLRMVTSEVADGVGRHTAVTFNGVKIGTVDHLHGGELCAVEPLRHHRLGAAGESGWPSPGAG